MSFIKTVLVDANSVARLSLYVECCNSASCSLGTPIEDILKKFYCSKGINEECLNIQQIKEGYKLFYYITHSGDIKIYFSHFGEIELLDIFLDRAFDSELSKKAIPFRIRRKKPFRVQVILNYQEEVANYWENIQKQLRENNVDLSYVEEEDEAIHDIIQICKIITKYVALEPVDLYLYSTAIYLRADEIYTHDSELKSIINKIYSDSSWATIKNNIIKDLINCFPKFEQEFSIENNFLLPKGISSKDVKIIV